MTIAFPKPVRRRDPSYIRWIRRQGCLICRRYAQAHHIHFGGVGTKGSDYDTVPLCARHHDELHAVNQPAFGRQYKLDFEAEVKTLQAKYDAAGRPQLAPTRTGLTKRGKRELARCGR